MTTIITRFIKPSLMIFTILNLKAMDGIKFINEKATFSEINFEEKTGNETEKEKIENINEENENKN